MQCRWGNFWVIIWYEFFIMCALKGVPANLPGRDTGDHAPPVPQHLVDSTPLLEELSQQAAHHIGPGALHAVPAPWRCCFDRTRISTTHLPLGGVLALQRHGVGWLLPVAQEQHNYALFSEAGGLPNICNVFVVVNARVAVLVCFWGWTWDFRLFVWPCGRNIWGGTQHLLRLIWQRGILCLKIWLQSPYRHSELVDLVLYPFPASPGGVLPVRRLTEDGDQVGVGHLAVGLVGQVGHQQGHALDDARDATTPQW